MLKMNSNMAPAELSGFERLFGCDSTKNTQMSEKGGGEPLGKLTA
jgi:hypothetical protein